MRKNLFLSIFFGLLATSGLIFFQKQLEIFVFDSFFNQPHELLLAQISSTFQPNNKEPAPELQAEAVVSLKIDKNGREKVLVGKNINEILPIASLTKLMTALVAMENYSDLSEKILISKEAVLQNGDAGQLKVGESVSTENLIYMTLIESGNDAAFALAEKTGIQQFLEKMNLKAKELKMLNTHFSNPTGLDGNENYSTGEDLLKLIKYIILNQPRIFEITSLHSVEIFNEDGSLHHSAVNTDELLGKIPGIIGSKTGFNEEALGCLILIVKSPSSGYFLNVLLGSPDRFGEMEKLVNWET